MKFKDFRCQIWKDTWYIIPTIEIYLDDPRWRIKNFGIAIHIMCIHMRWFWTEERKRDV